MSGQNPPRPTNGKLSAKQQAAMVAKGIAPAGAPSCTVPARIGLFFDGTNNNEKRDRPENCHSNIVRLYDAYPAPPISAISATTSPVSVHVSQKSAK